MSRKRLHYGLSASLLLSTLLLGVVSASDYQQYPILPPQVPWDGEPTEAHEFVR